MIFTTYLNTNRNNNVKCVLIFLLAPNQTLIKKELPLSMDIKICFLFIDFVVRSFQMQNKILELRGYFFLHLRTKICHNFHDKFYKITLNLLKLGNQSIVYSNWNIHENIYFYLFSKLFNSFQRFWRVRGEIPLAAPDFILFSSFSKVDFPFKWKIDDKRIFNFYHDDPKKRLKRYFWKHDD